MNKNLFFCNIGWMSRYEGLEDKPDKIVGGGRHVIVNKRGNEVCNFLACRGRVYGYVETIDQKINIERIGAKKDDDYVDGVTVIWTAKNPDVGGRYVVGWYKNARVYRECQPSVASSGQHRRDEVKDYRISAKASDASLVPIEYRSLSLGKGWMGRNQLWYAQEKAKKYKAVAAFLDDLAKFMMSMPDAEIAIDDTLTNKKLKAGTRDAVIKARIGQGPFRKKLLKEWGEGCAVTGCEIKELLRASHIKPWRDSNNDDRIARQNGLLLIAGIDAAFDKGLISFSDNGRMLVSERLSRKDKISLGIGKTQRLRLRPKARRKRFLKYHRENIFKG